MDLVPLSYKDSSFDIIVFIRILWWVLDFVPLSCKEGSFDIILFIRILW